jgi:TFIIF-interacting CTD phosphatase-like protein
LIIDNVEANFKLQKENGIKIKNFEGDENDNELVELIDDLKYIVDSNCTDVRDYLHIVREKMEKRNNQIDFSFIGNN